MKSAAEINLSKETISAKSRVYRFSVIVQEKAGFYQARQNDSHRIYKNAKGLRATLERCRYGG